MRSCANSLFARAVVCAALLGCAPGPPESDGPAPTANAPTRASRSSARAAAVSGAIANLHGWRWQDITNNIGALRDMGFTAIQISPHTSSCAGGFGTGYDPYDYRSFESGFGSEAELYWLIQTAHWAGVQIYADMVMNHMCTAGYHYPRFSWNDFHHNGGIENWSDPAQLEGRDLLGLNDLAQESDYVRGELFDFLVKSNDMGFDGYRWDAAKHVPLWYWRDHVVSNTSRWGKYSYGEVYDGNPDYLQRYVDAGMAVTDYNLYFACAENLKFGGDLRRLDGAGYAIRNGAAALTFIENHDVPAPANRWLANGLLAAYPGYPLFANVALGDSQLTNLLWIHNHKAHGTYVSRYSDRDTLVFERAGNLLAGYNQSDDWRTIGVQTSWNHTRLHDYSGHTDDIWTDDNGRTTVNIPPGSYVLAAP